MNEDQILPRGFIDSDKLMARLKERLAAKKTEPKPKKRQNNNLYSKTISIGIKERDILEEIYKSTGLSRIALGNMAIALLADFVIENETPSSKSTRRRTKAEIEADQARGERDGRD